VGVIQLLKCLFQASKNNTLFSIINGSIFLNSLAEKRVELAGATDARDPLIKLESERLSING